MVLEDRILLAAHANQLQHRLMAALATPKALAGGFAIGFLASLLRRPHKDDHAEPESHAGGRSWMQMLIHDFAMPLAMSALQSKLTQADDHAEPE